MTDIDTAAKKHAAELMDKLTEKRCAHMSDLVEAFKRAMVEIAPAPKANPCKDERSRIMVEHARSRWVNQTKQRQPEEDDGA